MARPSIASKVADVLASRREVRDVDRRAADRRLLAESESARRQLEEIVRHMPVGVIIAEAPSGRLILGNQQVERVWRHEFHAADAVEGYERYRGFHTDGRPYEPEEWPLARSVRTGEVVERERVEVLRGDETMGVIEVSSAPVRAPDGEVVAGVAVFEDITERVRGERALHLLAATSELLDASLQVEDTIERITRLVVPELADVCAVYLVERDRARRLAVVGADASLDELVEDMRSRPPIDARDTRSPIAEVIASGRSLLLPELHGERLRSIAEDDRQAELLERLGVGSTVIAPLRARGTVLGAVLMAAFRPSRILVEEDLPLVEDIARRAALALDNARLYAREHRTAELLQRNLLPQRLPTVDGAAVTARYVAAGLRDRVGGDWYDVLVLPGGLTGLAIGDVAGHGVRAATAMGRLRSLLRAFALEGSQPAEALGRLNTVEHRSVVHSDMATVFFGIVDHDAGTLRYASAGHPAPIAIAADGEARLLEVTGAVPIGVRPHAPYEESVIELERGGTLLMFTDGLVERRDEPIDAGVERVRRAAAGGQVAELETLCERVIDAALGGRRPDDDAALLAFRLLPVATTRLELHVPAEPRSLAMLRQRLRRWLADASAAQRDADEILLACGEACANAIEHAYGPADAMLGVEGAIAEGTLELVVVDSGSWRPARGADRGLGLRIIRSLMDDVEIQAGPEGTRVRMRRRIDRGEDASA